MSTEQASRSAAQEHDLAGPVDNSGDARATPVDPDLSTLDPTKIANPTKLANKTNLANLSEIADKANKAAGRAANTVEFGTDDTLPPAPGHAISDSDSDNDNHPTTPLRPSDAQKLLLTTDPALADASGMHRRRAAKAAKSQRTQRTLRDHAGIDPEVARIRLTAGRPIPGTRYRLIRWLGEGGMGVVYEAEHIDIERRVAMKILRLDLSLSPDIAKVFRDEARAANRVGSRNIVEIYDFGEISDGRLFFCMELICGPDLTTRTEEGIAPGELIGLLRQVCKALCAAHAVGIVHRDIKPENILLIDDESGRPGMVKIVDFGVAAILGGEGDGGPIAGTPHYMAPEQIRGDAFDGRLDMYSVGCMAYELLASKPPFDGNTIEAILLAQLDDPPPPLAEACPERTIPPALEAVICRCLAKEPADRYESMDELEAALCEAQITAGLHSSWDDLPLPNVDPERRAYLSSNMLVATDIAPRRRSRWIWPLAAGLVALLSVGATMAMMSDEPSTEVSSAVDHLTEEARKAAVAHRWVVSEGTQVSAYQRVRELEELKKPLASTRALDLRREFASALVDLGNTLWPVEGAQPMAAIYYQWATHFEPTNELARERSLLSDTELALARKRAEDDSFLDAERMLAKIARAAISEDRDEKQALLTEVFTDKKQGSILQRALLADVVRTAKIVDDDTMDEITAVLGLPAGDGRRIGRIGRIKGAEGAIPSNATSSDDNPNDDGGETGLDHEGPNDAGRNLAKAASLSAKGKAALRKGDRDSAETLFHQALGHNSRNIAALAGLSDISFDRTDYQKALVFAKRAVKIAPANKALRIRLGDANFALLRYNDALVHYERAAALGESRANARIAKVRAKLGSK